MSETFDFIETLKGRNYPTEEVVVYTDEGAIRELAGVREELVKHTDPEDKEYKALERKAKKLAKEIEASKLVYHLRGVAPGVVEELYSHVSEDATEAEAVAVQNKHWAATLIKVENAEGQVDERKFTETHIEEMRAFLPPYAQVKISNAVRDLMVDSAIYDQTVNSGFLPKP